VYELICLLKEPEFLAGRQARIIYKGKHIGTFGIVHPEVLLIPEIMSACFNMAIC